MPVAEKGMRGSFPEEANSCECSASSVVGGPIKLFSDTPGLSFCETYESVLQGQGDSLVAIKPEGNQIIQVVTFTFPMTLLDCLHAMASQ